MVSMSRIDVGVRAEIETKTKRGRGKNTENWNQCRWGRGGENTQTNEGVDAKDARAFKKRIAIFFCDLKASLGARTCV